jgi:hypothetical protein
MSCWINSNIPWQSSNSHAGVGTGLPIRRLPYAVGIRSEHVAGGGPPHRAPNKPGKARQKFGTDRPAPTRLDPSGRPRTCLDGSTPSAATRSQVISQVGAPFDRNQVSTGLNTKWLWPTFPQVRAIFRTGGRYWDRTSDLFRVRHKFRAQHSPAEHENRPWTSPDVHRNPWALSSN